MAVVDHHAGRRAVDGNAKRQPSALSGAESPAILGDARRGRTLVARDGIDGSTIVPRSLLVAVGSTRDVAVDAISLNGFDLGFYRQLSVTE
jgi:hypothetical protein